MVGQKWIVTSVRPETNTLAYYGMDLITEVKRLMKYAPGSVFILLVTYEWVH
jgi:hypothetical protein